MRKEVNHLPTGAGFLPSDECPIQIRRLMEHLHLWSPDTAVEVARSSPENSEEDNQHMLILRGLPVGNQTWLGNLPNKEALVAKSSISGPFSIAMFAYRLRYILCMSHCKCRRCFFQIDCEWFTFVVFVFFS